MEKKKIIRHREIRKVPKKYIISLRKEPLEHGEQDKKVGEIIEHRTNKIVADIVVSDKAVADANFRDMYITYNQKSDVHIICMTASQLERFQTYTPENLFSLYHELGHIHNGDFIKALKKNDARQDRKAAILRGTVCEREKNADAFTLSYISKGEAILALNKLKIERKMRDIQVGVENSQMSKLTLLEYDYRIKKF